MKQSHELPSIALVRSLLAYDPTTGIITWTGPKSNNNLRRAGDVQGTLGTTTGYLHVRLGERYFGKRNLYCHRVAWALYYGEWPANYIDHINGDKTDNRIDNLRSATKRENKYNSRVRADSRIGLKGVSYVPKGRNGSAKSKPYRAQIVANGQRYRLGDFKTAEEAHAAYCAAAARLHGEFARTE